MNALYVLSGPPADRSKDLLLMRKFFAFDGGKAVCGSVTLAIFCKIFGKSVKLKFSGSNACEPPEYEVEGLDFASEGLITLNKCFEVLNGKDSKATYYPPRKLAELMLACKKIHFIEGSAVNSLHDDKLFESAGLLPRSEIIDKIIKTLCIFGKTAIKEII
jgi:hypothetical protein